MALKVKRSEHGGDKGSSRKSGHWGTRVEAKSGARKARRAADRKAVGEGC